MDVRNTSNRRLVTIEISLDSDELLAIKEELRDVSPESHLTLVRNLAGQVLKAGGMQ